MKSANVGGEMEEGTIGEGVDGSGDGPSDVNVNGRQNETIAQSFATQPFSAQRSGVHASRGMAKIPFFLLILVYKTDPSVSVKLVENNSFHLVLYRVDVTV